MNSGYVYVGNNIFPTLLAISESEQEIGLMNKPFPPPIMSFLYEYPKVVKFWMKNTPSPLDIVFCHNGKITQIHKGEPYSTMTIGGDVASDLVIEFPHGTVKESGIKYGDNVGLIKPTECELKRLFSENKPKFIKF
jgi:uncharacterized membrane protein (UPF0127 family)